MKTWKTLKLVIPAFLVVGALAGCARDWHESVTSAQLRQNATKLTAELKWCQQKQAQGQDISNIEGCVAAHHVEQKNVLGEILTAPVKLPPY